MSDMHKKSSMKAIQPNTKIIIDRPGESELKILHQTKRERESEKAMEFLLIINVILDIQLACQWPNTNSNAIACAQSDLND